MCSVMKEPIIGPLWWGEGDGELKATKRAVIQALTWWNSRLSNGFSNDPQLLQDGTSPFFGCIVCHFVNKCSMTWHAGVVRKVTRPNRAEFLPLGLCEECCMSRDIFRP